MTLFLFSCSTADKHKVYSKGAELIGKAATSVADKTYKKKIDEYKYAELKCDVEAVTFGTDVKAYVEKVLKVPPSEPSSGMMSLSVGGSIAKVACGLVAGKLVPEVINKNLPKYQCFAVVASDGAEDFIKDKLCDEIKF